MPPTNFYADKLGRATLAAYLDLLQRPDFVCDALVQKKNIDPHEPENKRWLMVDGVLP